MRIRFIHLAGITFALLVSLLALPSSNATEVAPTFCDYCWAAGNCCNPVKTLCVSCSATGPEIEGAIGPVNDASR